MKPLSQSGNPAEFVEHYFDEGQDWMVDVGKLLQDRGLRVPRCAEAYDTVGLGVEFAIGFDACVSPYAGRIAGLPPGHRDWVHEQLSIMDGDAAPEMLLRLAYYLASLNHLLFHSDERGSDREVIANGIASAYPHPSVEIWGYSEAETELADLWELYRDSARSQLHGLGSAEADVRLHRRTSLVHGEHTSAYADLIAGRTIVELKTREFRPGHAWPLMAARQVLRYGLLADPSRYEIAEAGIYFSRYGLLMRWPLQELADVLAGHRVDLQVIGSHLRKL